LGSVISLHKATLSYGGVEVLREITLDIREGEFVFIFGDSGKSSLLKLMGGIEEPQGGTVLHGENNPYKGSDRKRSEVLKNTGHLFQEAALLANLSLFENVALPLRYHSRLNEDEIRAQVTRMFSLLDMRVRTELRPAVFPLGVRKMVALARALILEPDKIFLDDLVNGLDHKSQEKMAKILLDIKRRKNISAVIITDEMEFVSLLADRILILHEGRLIADDSKTAIFNSEDPRVKSIIAQAENESSSQITQPKQGAGEEA
jgi:phospholipid/cholesterol/gamma-HCH transport system ATP-binding protein